MKIRTLRTAALLAGISLALACAARAEVSLESRRATFQAQVDGTVSNCVAIRKQAEVDYRKNLQRMAIKADEAGEAEKTVAIRAELERCLINGFVAEGTEAGLLPAIAAARQAYFNRLVDALNKRDLRVMQLAMKYKEDLQAMLKSPQVSDDAAALLAIKKEADDVDNLPQVAEAAQHVVFVNVPAAVPEAPAPLPAATNAPVLAATNAAPASVSVVAPAPKPAPVEEAIFVRSQTDARGSAYYVGRWVWVPGQGVWQREILLFNSAPRPDPAHAVWNYVRTMARPKAAGVRDWDNYLYREFAP